MLENIHEFTSNISYKIMSCWDYMILKGGLFFSFLLTTFLTAIGFPSQTIYFIIFLIICDILTRFHATVYKHCGYFSIRLFFKAWKEKVLSSKKLKNGLFTKILFYSILLYIAHQCKISDELYLGTVISNFMYSSIIILDIISILENMGESNFKMASFIKTFFEKQKDKLIDDNSQDGDK
jgi:hypothetical protein